MKPELSNPEGLGRSLGRWIHAHQERIKAGSTMQQGESRRARFPSRNNSPSDNRFSKACIEIGQGVQFVYVQALTFSCSALLFCSILSCLDTCNSTSHVAHTSVFHGGGSRAGYSDFKTEYPETEILWRLAALMGRLPWSHRTSTRYFG